MYKHVVIISYVNAFQEIVLNLWYTEKENMLIIFYLYS